LVSNHYFFYFDGFEYGFYSTNKIIKCLHEEAGKKMRLSIAGLLRAGIYIAIVPLHGYNIPGWKLPAIRAHGIKRHDIF
jgi:hypothetical protein